MPGRTGKLMRQALRERGPRMVLAEVEHENGQRMLVVFREHAEPWLFHCSDFYSGPHRVRTIAKSFTLSYLLRITHTMRPMEGK